MNHRGFTRLTCILLLTACAILPLLSACQPVSVEVSLPTQPAASTPAPLPTQAPLTEVTTQPAPNAAVEVGLDLAGLATNQTVETVAAVPADAGGPFWEAAPEYRRLTLEEGYPVSEHLLKPQIFVYPVAGLAEFNENAGQMAADLQSLLESRQPGDHLPYLPLYNAAQVMHSQVEFLAFKNGSGVRFLTQFDQAPLPVNNYELLYTFQGLTSDGRYYVSAVLPITHPELPASAQVSAEQAADLAEFPTYLEKTLAWLEQQPSASFTPNLASLDALVQSIEIK